jgi:hypothetical protein
MRSPEGGECIIRTVNPVSIFEIYQGKIEFDKSKFNSKYFKSYSFENEQFTLRLHHYFTTEVMVGLTEIEVYKKMDDAAHWYFAYCKWENENLNDLENGLD